MQQANIFQPPIPQKQHEAYHWSHLMGASISLALSHALEQSNHPILILVPDSLTAEHLIEELRFFHGHHHDIHLLSGWETLPYDHFSPHHDIISERLSVLSRLSLMQKGAIVCTIDTLLHPLPHKSFIQGQTFFLKIGEVLNIDILRTQLTQAGYYAVSQVREHGEFAIRGSIIDLYPMGAKQPFRIDLLDNEIDSIRIFSPDTQRTTEKIDAIQLLPAKEFPLTETAIEHFRQEWRTEFSGNPLACPTYQDISEGICAPGIEYYLPLFFSETSTLFDYLPQQSLVITVGDIKTKAEEFWHEVTARYEQNRHDISRPLLAPTKLFMSLANLNEALKHYPRIGINGISDEDTFSFATETTPSLNINHQSAHPLAALKEFLESYSGRMLFCAESLGRREVILQLFKTIQFNPTFFSSWQAFLASSEKYGIAIASLEQGFQLSSPSLTVVAETELYGKRIMQRRMRKKTTLDTDTLIRDLTELQIGDPIVHIEHGVGRYRGLQTLTIGEQLAEFLCLEYQGSDKLFVPISSLHLVGRYTGADPEHAPINKLGSEQWQKAKRRAAEKVRDVAAELLDLYAKRAARPGFAYTVPQEQYDAFAAAFPFEETPDQLQAIQQVYTDMTSDKPMDRVICGDVGFGKTEVAMRAAFLAIQNNRQVALLVPTTLLAQQHFQNFQDRFADWPIQVELLSRFRTGKEQENVLNKLAEGKVDIVIGTHKLLQTNIQFKSLGLLIIDEEHRFGVKQKEKFKALRSQIDILTLTATPIPRTLNMTLAGIRDLSVIATPPARRLSVKTFVHDYQKSIIQEAIQREVMRGGQVYFLHNDISTIAKKAEEIKTLVSEARTSVAHGQMHERELERVMSDFYHRRSNVLVCSTIIESGIDIPTANTIIINRADKFGIAQLHQLRGRVGRSHHQAYAYLLIPDRQSITNDAVKRLEAIAAYDDLGIGFTLSTHDLEIRGAGELLGEEQSGDMQEIGFTLYMDLLSRAVDALKEGHEPGDEKALLEHRSEIDLHITALIPENYLNDVQLRLQFYKRIATAKSVEALDKIQVELIDRFGLLPQALKNLFATSEIKLKAERLGIVRIEASDKGGKLEFSERPNVKPETIITLIQQKNSIFRLEGPTRLRFTLPTHTPSERIGLVDNVLALLS